MMINRLPEALWTLTNRINGVSIGTRLAAVVLVTGAATLGAIGVLTSELLDRGLHEQAEAMSNLSEHQLSRKLDGEAQLARARLDMIFVQADQQVRALAQRSDITKAVESRNDITIRETLGTAAKTANLDVVIAVAQDGRAVGANLDLNLLALTDSLNAVDIGAAIKKLLAHNSRVQPLTYRDTRRLGPRLASAIGVADENRLGHVAVDPVFDDFGDVIGVLLGVRVLAPIEKTLEQFSTLANVGVVVFSERGTLSASGARSVEFGSEAAMPEGLLRTADGGSVARCVSYVADLQVCVLTDVAEVKVSQEQMYRIGAEQTRWLKVWFLVLAAAALVALVGALLISVRHATTGLSPLSRAATAVAKGNLEVPFLATGFGQIFELGLAFETMLANLRLSLGRIQQLAFFDPVTGLANREKIRLDGVALLQSGANDQTVLFMFFDLNRFKAVNDTFGHNFGDILLKQFASRLTSLLRHQHHQMGTSEALVARLGGDEFLAIVPVGSDDPSIDAFVNQLLTQLCEPYDIGGSRMLIGASLGIAVYPQHGTSYETLLIHADIAMYQAKRRGGSSYAVFTPAAAESAHDRFVMENDLRVALQERHFEVYYQPKISCATGMIVGVEALARWKHAERGYISPTKFIPIAEEAGLLPEIGQFVIERAIEEVGPLLADNVDITVAVNVSVLQLEDLSFCDKVKAILAQNDFPLGSLEFEITESMAMRNSEIAHSQIVQLRSLGIRIAIDDFGTGYSNLARLARLPIDILKLDRSLVQDVSSNAEKRLIARTILKLARSFGFDTVVEGVDTQADLDVLAREGADMVQGFLFSPAVPIETIQLMLQPGRLAQLMSPHKTDRNDKVVRYPGKMRRNPSIS